MIGSLAGCTGVCCVAPFDIVKTRMQVSAGSGHGILHTAKVLIHSEGVLALYSGLSAALGRQAIYGGARMGLFDKFQDLLRDSKTHGQLPFWKNGMAAIAAGAAAAFLGNPMDVSLIRMQADATLPISERRGYRHVGHALATIMRNEGVRGLWTGGSPTVVRAMAGNFGSLSFNASSKDWLLHVGLAGNTQTCAAGFIGGLASAFFGMPIDFVKTQMQKQTRNPSTGEMLFQSSFDCIQKTWRIGGCLRFYTGFPAYIARVAPFQTITLVVRDKLKELL